MKFHRHLLGTLLFGMLPLAAHAGALEALQHFIDHTRSFAAEFSLTSRSEDGRSSSSSSGRLAFQKPGKFRWEVEAPYQQRIIGDGREVWIYDPDLAQVTVRETRGALGATPAALLTGAKGDLKNFDFTEAGQADGLDWADATPKTKESGFIRVRLGFAANGDLRALVFFDHFGQTTTVRLVNPQSNLPLLDEQFRFTPPAGVEVIRDGPAPEASPGEK
jgi:outer membrane lipoprotein carrier protein